MLMSAWIREAGDRMQGGRGHLRSWEAGRLVGGCWAGGWGGLPLSAEQDSGIERGPSGSSRPHSMYRRWVRVQMRNPGAFFQETKVKRGEAESSTLGRGAGASGLSGQGLSGGGRREKQGSVTLADTCSLHG